MFGTNIARTGLSLTRVLGGISKTLEVARQVMPIYEQAKPMAKNARKILGVIKEFSKSDKKFDKTISKEKTKVQEKIPTKVGTNQNHPVFFQ